MTSPLLPYANAYLLATSGSTPQVENGRIVSSAGTQYIIQCYLKRQDSSGTTTGADSLPSNSSSTGPFQGVGGDVFLYRGYALRYAPLLAILGGEDPVPEPLNWVPLASDAVPSWFADGASVIHRHGSEPVKNGSVKLVTGKYGGTGIDAIVSQNIGGVPIVVRSGEVIN